MFWKNMTPPDPCAGKRSKIKKSTPPAFWLRCRGAVWNRADCLACLLYALFHMYRKPLHITSFSGQDRGPTHFFSMLYPNFVHPVLTPLTFIVWRKTFFKILFQKTKVMQDLNNIRVTKLSGLVVNISCEWTLVQPLCLISTFSPSSKQPTSVPAGWFLPHCLGGAMRGRNLPQKRSHLLVPAQGFMLHKMH